MKNRLSSLARLAVVIVIGLGALEVATRLIIPQQLARDYLVADEALGVRVRPNADYDDRDGNGFNVRTNGAGFRMAEEVDPSPARRHVMVYGDFSTFGFGVPYKNSYFALLKAELERNRPDFQLLNASAPGYSTGHVRIRMARDIPALHPAALIYFLNSNDVFDNAIADTDYRVTEYRIAPDGTVTLTDRPPHTRWKRFLLNYTPCGWLDRNSHLFVAAKGALRTLIGRKRQADPLTASARRASDRRESEARREAGPLAAITLAHLRRIKALAAERHLPLIVVWVPAWEEIFRRDRDLPLVSLLRTVRQRTAALLGVDGAAGGSVFLDTVRMLPPVTMMRPQETKLHFISKVTDTGFTGEDYFNRIGNSWYAGLIAPILAATLNAMVPKAP